MTRSSRPLSVLSLLSASALFSALPHAAAQSTVTTLTGYVMDSAGALLPDSHVTVISKSTSATRTAVTGKDGSFRFLALAPGGYRLRVSHAAFQASEVSSLVLNVSDDRELLVHLRPGNVHEVVTVTDTSNLNVDTAVATTIDRTFIENLPLNGRTFQNLIALAPGVVANSGGPGQFSVNGQRTTENYFTVDGVSANVGMSASASSTSTAGADGFGTYAGGSIPGFNAWGGTNSLLSVDSLEEFKVDTATSSADAGRGLGAQVQLRSRSGSNSFHGSLSEYLRNEIFDANDWYFNHNIDPVTGRYAPLPRKGLRLNNFGGTFGGPILRNKLFFFVNYEGMRIHQPTSYTSYSVVSRVRSQLSGTVLQLVNALPVPTGPELTGYALDPTDNTYKPNQLRGIGTFSATSISVSSMNSYSGRLDWNPSPRWNVFVRLSDAPTSSGQQLASFQGLGSSDIRFVTTGFTYSHGSNFSNDLRLNLTENRASGFGQLIAVAGAQPYDYAQIAPAGFTPQNSSVRFSLAGSGYTLGASTNNLQRQINATDTVYLNLKRHSLSFGEDYRYLLPRFSPANLALTLNFASPANLTGFTTTKAYTANGVLIPAGSTFPQGTLSGNFYAAGTWVTTLQGSNAAFVTDTYRVNDRLTVNLGLRWEVNPAPHGTAKKPLYTLAGWTPGSADYSGLQFAPGGTSIYPTLYSGFSPRVGVAYIAHPGAGSSTVVRAAYSRDTSVGTVGAAGSAGLFPYYTSGVIKGNGGLLTYPLSTSLLPTVQPLPLTSSLSGQQFNYFDPGYRVPYAHQMTVSVQQQFGKATSANFAYVGTAGRALLRRFIYQVPYSATSQFAGDSIYVSSNPNGNADTSDYNSLQVTLSHNLSRGLQFLTNYTWSHALDTGSQDTPATTLSTGNPLQLTTYRADAQRGRSDSDHRNLISAAATYMPPTMTFGDRFLARAGAALINGWGLAPTFTAQSGGPVNVYYTRYLSSTLSTSLQPDRVSGQPIWLDDGTQIRGRRLNPAAYSIPTTAVQGNAPRNAANGFAHYTFDTSIYRAFNLADRARLRARADIFNVLNHPSFPDASGNLGYLSWNYTSNTQGAFQTNPSFGTLGSSTAYTAGQGLANSQAADGGLTGLFQSSSPRSIQLSLKLEF